MCVYCDNIILLVSSVTLDGLFNRARQEVARRFGIYIRPYLYYNDHELVILTIFAPADCFIVILESIQNEATSVNDFRRP